MTTKSKKLIFGQKNGERSFLVKNDEKVEKVHFWSKKTKKFIFGQKVEKVDCGKKLT